MTKQAALARTALTDAAPLATPTAPASKRRPKGPRPKHVPQRMCVSCRGHDAKRGLIRIVRTPERVVELDPTGRKNGRGAYLCHRPACWDKALASGSLARALNTEVDAATVATLRDYAAGLRQAEADAAALAAATAAQEPRGPITITVPDTRTRTRTRTSISTNTRGGTTV